MIINPVYERKGDTEIDDFITHEILIHDKKNKCHRVDIPLFDCVRD